jgi:hypothetical protein
MLRDGERLKRFRVESHPVDAVDSREAPGHHLQRFQVVVDEREPATGREAGFTCGAAPREAIEDEITGM